MMPLTKEQLLEARQNAICTAFAYSTAKSFPEKMAEAQKIYEFLINIPQ